MFLTSIHVKTAEKAAQAAKDAVLSGSAGSFSDLDSESSETADPSSDKPTWPPRGILVLKKPVGFNPGIYR